jgi:hypothetical protein
VSNGRGHTFSKWEAGISVTYLFYAYFSGTWRDILTSISRNKSEAIVER